MSFSFKKYEGLGNDFLLLDQVSDPTLPTPSAEEIQKLCDRRFGVGADGILIFANPDPKLVGSQSASAKVRMIYFNADGSRAETCFNGLRCIALHAVLRNPACRQLPAIQTPTEAYPILIQADTGLLRAGVHPEQGQVRIAFTVNDNWNPLATVRSTKVPITSEGGLLIEGLSLSMGNPHFVLWEEKGSLKELNRIALRWGREVETSPAFPYGTNFEIAVKTSSNHMQMAVWERGVGITLACGSGATAAVCSAVERGIFPSNEPITVEMAGGEVTVTVNYGTIGTILVEGPANRVFSGKVDPAHIHKRTN